MDTKPKIEWFVNDDGYWPDAYLVAKHGMDLVAVINRAGKYPGGSIQQNSETPVDMELQIASIPKGGKLPVIRRVSVGSLGDAMRYLDKFYHEDPDWFSKESTPNDA